jgi:hypothetical protein
MYTERYLPGERTVEGPAHPQRSESLPLMQAGEVEHLMASFLANRSITTRSTQVRQQSKRRGLCHLTVDHMSPPQLDH